MAKTIHDKLVEALTATGEKIVTSARTKKYTVCVRELANHGGRKSAAMVKTAVALNTSARCATAMAHSYAQI